MAFNNNATSNSSSSGNQRWTDKINQMIHNEVHPDEKIRSCVFTVPKRLSAEKPEAYTPQLLGLGPYNHFKPELYEMERYKLAAVSHVLMSSGHNFEDIVTELKNEEATIRACYLKYLDYDGDTLASIIAIDGIFLIDFIDGVVKKGKMDEMDCLIYAARMLTVDDLLGDIMMLENQIPFYLLMMVYASLCAQGGEVDGELLATLSYFCDKVSPFKIDASRTMWGFFLFMPVHLLEGLYIQIVADSGPQTTTQQEKPEEVVKGELELPESSESGGRKLPGAREREQQMGKILAILDVLGRLVGVLAQPVQFIRSLPSEILQLLSWCPVSKQGDKESVLVVEIMIPSVSQLLGAGMRLGITDKGIKDIRFEEKSATLYLPEIKLNVNTEIILRNLVAYEASSRIRESHELDLAFYTDLMCGIVDTAMDARLLRGMDIIKGDLADEEVARLFNSMNKSPGRRTTSNNIVKAAYEVNKYYNRKPKVRFNNLLMQYVAASWQVLTIFCTLLLLSLLSLQAFCQVYGCSSRWFKLGS
ncbi:hypothetical protein NMG60_11013171 [Bertholletia excelsa]